MFGSAGTIKTISCMTLQLCHHTQNWLEHFNLVLLLWLPQGGICIHWNSYSYTRQPSIS